MSDTDQSAKRTIAEMLPRIPADGVRSTEAFRHGSLLIKLYAPRGHDPQKPHEQDEIYVVASGSGVFVAGDKRYPFGPGDMLFVVAGVAHRFEEFTDDVVFWVAFWGPKGGEVPA